MAAPDDPALKAVLVSLMRRGIVTPTEAATVAGISRQSAAAWIGDPPGAARDRRWRYVIKQVDYALRIHDRAAQVRGPGARPGTQHAKATSERRPLIFPDIMSAPTHDTTPRPRSNPHNSKHKR